MRLIYGVGVNDADYRVNNKGVRCPYVTCEKIKQALMERYNEIPQRR